MEKDGVKKSKELKSKINAKKNIENEKKIKKESDILNKKKTDTKIKSVTEKKQDLFVKFSVKIPNKEVVNAIDEVVNKYSSDVKLPGFRKGNVPVDVIKSHYKEAITNEALDKLIENNVLNKIQKEKMHIASQPIVNKIDYKEGEDLKADVLVELLPEIKLPDFEKIEMEIPKKELKIDAYDENKQINAVLEANKKQVPLKDRAIRDNDIVLLKCQSKIIQTKKMTPRKTEHFNVNKEEKFEIMDLYDEIIGKNLGDKVVFKRKYPKNYVKKIWAEKDIEHYVEVENIYEFKKPLLNKEFLTSIGMKDEEAFKKQLKEEYEKYTKNQREEKIRGKIIKKLYEIIDFSIPKTLIEQELMRMKPTIDQASQIEDTKKRKEYIDLIKNNAEESVKFLLIFNSIMKKFKFEVNNDEVEKEYKQIAEQNKLPLIEVRKYYMGSNKINELKESLLNIKIMNFLKEKVKIKEV
jgi:trigger factor